MSSNVDNKETKIILLNFSKKDAAVIASAGFCLEQGFLGRYREADHYAPFYSPHPLYEYDILIYNPYIPTGLENEFVNMRNLGYERGSFEALSKPFRTPPIVRIAFIGEEMVKPRRFFKGEYHSSGRYKPRPTFRQLNASTKTLPFFPSNLST